MIEYVTGLKVNGVVNHGKLARFPKKGADVSTVSYLQEYHPNNKQGMKNARKKERRGS